MIDISALTKLDEGSPVVFKDPNDIIPDQRGVITSWNQLYIFVKFDGDQSENGKACNPAHLSFIGKEVSEEEEEDCGALTVGAGTSEERKIKIKNYFRAEGKDHRLATIAELMGDQGYVIMIENPASTGRGAQNMMWLSKESFIMIFGTMGLYTAHKGWDMDKEVKDSYDAMEIKFSYSGSGLTDWRKEEKDGSDTTIP